MISIEGVSKSFGKLAAVKNVSLTIPDNCIYGLLGTNGAGKSTLLRMLSGVLKPDEGEIKFDGKGTLFFLPDEPYFFPNAEPRSMARFYQTMYSGFEGERFMEMLRAFELPEDKKLHSFSKGMKKQTFILAGICAGTEYLLCDEVFDGLDPLIRKSLKKLLEKEMRMRRLTILAASHNLRELEDICHTIGILHRGGVLLSRDIEKMQSESIKLQCVFDAGNEEGRRTLYKRLPVLSMEETGFVTRMIVKAGEEEVRQAMEEIKPHKYEILPMSIEEIFSYETEAAGYDIRTIIS